MKRLLLLVSLVALAATGCKKELVCPQGEVDCDGTCAALDQDPGHCGSCTHACGALEVCDGGVCACGAGTASCGGACADLTVDPMNCGTCGTACDPASATSATVCGGSGGCIPTADCAAPRALCGGSCVDLRTSARHCGACGVSCLPGTACIAGACALPPLYAACYWTNEVRPLSSSLGWGGSSLSLGTARPFRLALHERTLLAAAGQPQASLSFVSLASGAVSAVQLPFWDLEAVALVPGAALVTNAAAGTVEVLGLDGTVLDEIPMPDQQDAPNPMGLAVVGASAYVGLNNSWGPLAQKIVRLDLTVDACRAPEAHLPACAGPTDCAAGRRCVAGSCRRTCGQIGSVIDLTQVAGAADAGAIPGPTALATANGKVYVALANLAFGNVTCDGFTYSGYAVPGTSGRLAALDPSNLDTVSVVDLGSSCRSPSELSVRGSQVWVSCGSYCFRDAAPGAVVPVNVSGPAPAVGAAIPLGATVGGALAFCGSSGYVADQVKTGAVVRFDPVGATTSAPTVVCRADTNGNALASDIICTQ